MRRARAGRWVWVVVAVLPALAWAQPAAGAGPHFGVYLGVAGGGSMGPEARTGGGVGLTGELGFHLDEDWALSLDAGGFHSVNSSFLETSLVAHRSFGDEFFSLGAGVGAFTVPGLATTGLVVPVELDILPVFLHSGRPLFGLGIKLVVAPGIDLGTGGFALSAGLHLAALVVD